MAAADNMSHAVTLAGAMVGGGIALAGGAVGAAIGDGLAGSQSINLAFMGYFVFVLAK